MARTKQTARPNPRFHLATLPGPRLQDDVPEPSLSDGDSEDIPEPSLSDGDSEEGLSDRTEDLQGTVYDSVSIDSSGDDEEDDIIDSVCQNGDVNEEDNMGDDNDHDLGEMKSSSPRYDNEDYKSGDEYSSVQLDNGYFIRHDQGPVSSTSPRYISYSEYDEQRSIYSIALSSDDTTLSGSTMEIIEIPSDSDDDLVS